MLGAAWRENLGWPDGGIAPTPPLIRSAVDLIRRAASARDCRFRTGTTGIPTTSRRVEVLRAAAFTSGLRRYETGADAWRPDWVCYYFINDGATPSFVVDVSAHYQRKREALDCYRSQFAPGRPTARSPTRLTRGDRSASSSRAATRSSARSPASRSPRASSSASRSCARAC